MFSSSGYVDVPGQANTCLPRHRHNFPFASIPQSLFGVNTAKGSEIPVSNGLRLTASIPQRQELFSCALECSPNRWRPLLAGCSLHFTLQKSSCLTQRFGIYLTKYLD